MSSTYVACFLDAKTENLITKTKDKTAISDCFSAILEDEKKHLLIGPSNNGWGFSAIQRILEERKLLPARGSAVGKRVQKLNDYLQALIPAGDVAAVRKSCGTFDPSADPEAFQEELAAILTEWEMDGYAEELEDTLDEYVETFTSLLKTLDQAVKKKMGLIVLIPY